jgi:tetrachlorobenzoquinone reductase
VHRSPSSRGGISYVHDRLRIGAVLPVEGPANNFPLVNNDRYLLLT